MTAGFICMNVLGTVTIGMTMSLSTKSIQKFAESRGTLTLAVACFVSVGSVIIDGVGGHIYENGKRKPFLLCLGTETFVVLLIIGLACFK